MYVKIHFKLCSTHFRNDGGDDGNNNDASVNFKLYFSIQIYPLSQDPVTPLLILYGVTLKGIHQDRCP